MWWSDRRAFLLGLAALPACGFEPVYGPNSQTTALIGKIDVAPPSDEEGFQLVSRLKARLGEDGGPWLLTAAIELDEEAVGILPDGTITRYNVEGAVAWQLSDGEIVLTSGREESFTSYTATSTTVATIFARRDANTRLMTILADRIVAELLRTAPDWMP